MAILFSFLSSSAAQAERLCAGLSGKARTDCLNAEVRRRKEELAEIERKNRNLDRALKAGCTADKVIGTVASAKAPGGGYAYRAGRGIGNKITGQNPCK